MNSQNYIDENHDNITLGKNIAGLAVDTPIFFAVSPLKLFVMSLCTFGLYDLYWFYKNWEVIKNWDHPVISPFWRAFFAYFFCFGVFQLIREYADSQSIKSGYSPIVLTIGWIYISFPLGLPDSFSMISYLAVLFIIPAQKTVNSMNQSLVPDQDKNDKFTAWNIVAIVVAVVIVGIVVFETISEPLWLAE